jgi:hypothetical protein
VEAVAQEAAPGGVEDLPAPGGEVGSGYTRHPLNLKRTLVLDKSPLPDDDEAVARTPKPVALAGLVAIGVVLVQGLLILWYAWPSGRAAPRDLPLVVAGPAPAANAVAEQLRNEQPGAFQVTLAPDAAAADQALRDREAYGAVVLGAGSPSLHLASAASPTVAALLTQAAQRLGNGQPVPVVDVVPTPPKDPRGAGFASGLLPLLLTSAAAGVALLFVVRSHAARLVGMLAFGVLAGLVAAAVLHWVGVLTGGYLREAGVIGLLALAISATVAGLGAVLGGPGVGLGALLGFLLGNPISGLASAPELLPKPWGAVGQFMPPGAGATALRSVAFFDSARVTKPLLVLATWAAVGLLLTVVGHYRDRPGSHAAGQLGVSAVDRDEGRLRAER